jgi:putative transcription factor
MYDCEICGKKTEVLYVIDVEGAQLSVCASCSRGNPVIDEIGIKKETIRGKKVFAGRKQRIEAAELVDDYGERIRKAREGMKIDLKVLGEMINEKHSTLLRVEEGKMPPDINLTAKLEKALGIKLASAEEDREGPKLSKSGPITLGDAMIKKAPKPKDEI